MWGPSSTLIKMDRLTKWSSSLSTRNRRGGHIGSGASATGGTPRDHAFMRTRGQISAAAMRPHFMRRQRRRARDSRTTSDFSKLSKAALAGKPRGERRSTESLDHAVRQLVAKAIVPEGEIIDVFSAAGLEATRHQHPLRPFQRCRNPATDAGIGGLGPASAQAAGWERGRPGGNGVASIHSTFVSKAESVAAMARPLRIEFEDAIYHVTARGNERQRVFRAEFTPRWRNGCGGSSRRAAR